jgi:hypothetical protein
MNLRIAVVTLCAASANTPLPAHAQAAPVAAVEGVVSALARYPIVAIAEAHGIRQAVLHGDSLPPDQLASLWRTVGVEQRL